MLFISDNINSKFMTWLKPKVFQDMKKIPSPSDRYIPFINLGIPAKVEEDDNL